MIHRSLVHEQIQTLLVRTGLKVLVFYRASFFLSHAEKHFASSSFYDDGQHLYPTIEEQLKLCRQVAASLTAPRNITTRGAQMFYKRQKRAPKWTIENQPKPERSMNAPQFSFKIPKIASSVLEPKISRDGLPQCILKPNVFAERGGIYEVNMDEQMTADPHKCFELSRKLRMASEGRGARMFANKVQKAEKWVHDETTAPRHAQVHPLPLPVSEVKLKDLLGMDHYGLERSEGRAMDWGKTYNVVPKGWRPTSEGIYTVVVLCLAL